MLMSLLLMVFVARDAGVEAEVSPYDDILFYYPSQEHWGYYCEISFLAFVSPYRIQVSECRAKQTVSVKSR